MSNTLAIKEKENNVKESYKTNVVNGFAYKNTDYLLFKIKDNLPHNDITFRINVGSYSDILEKNNLVLGFLVSTIDKVNEKTLVILPHMHTDDPCQWSNGKVPSNGKVIFLNLDIIESISILGVYCTNRMDGVIDINANNANQNLVIHIE